MVKFRTYCLLTGLALVLALSRPNQMLAQESDSTRADSTRAEIIIDPEQVVTVDRITLRGNKKTKGRIIYREMQVNVGDSFKKRVLDSLLLVSQNNITNTSLFVVVDVLSKPLDQDRIEVEIIMKERWYLYPIPIFDLADRNFNEWWVNQNRDLSRVNYGIRFYYNNFRGRNERLKIVAQFGFTRLWELEYKIPYLDKKQKNGLILDLAFAENKNMAFRTKDHLQDFVDVEDDSLESSSRNLRERLRAGVTWTYRKSIRNFHHFSVYFFKNTVADTIAAINPDYFLDGRSKQQYLFLEYVFIRDYRDLRQYPLNGFYIEAAFQKSGIGAFDDVDLFSFQAQGAKYFDLKKGYYFSTLLRTKISTPNRQPYNLAQAIGYPTDYVRGFELNVTEGETFIYSASTFKKLIFQRRMNIDKVMPIDQFNTIPIAIYVKTYFDAGYVKADLFNPLNTRLVNTVIFGGGLGLDLVTFYDFVLRLEYSFNSEGENHFFLGFQAEF